MISTTGWQAPPQTEESSSKAKQLNAAQAHDFVLAFYRLLKACVLYTRENDVVHTLLNECLQTIKHIHASRNQLVLRVNLDQFYFNQRRVAVRSNSYPIFQMLAQELQRRQIGLIEITEGITRNELLEFVYLFWALEEQHESNAPLLMHALADRDFACIHVDRYVVVPNGQNASSEQHAVSMKAHSKEIYFHSIKAMKEVLDGVKNTQALNLRKAKHLMQHAVDTIVEDEATLLGLVNIRTHDEYTFSHSVNVAFCAIALGHRLGLPKRQLSYLGLAALFHDIGKVTIPQDILNKPGKLNADEWEVIRSHPVAGAIKVLQIKEWGPLTARMLASTFEHHMKYDASGYPRLRETHPISLFGRIITLVDCYDAMGRSRAYRQLPYQPEQITGYMLERSGRDFDPVLVKIFINMIGVYPLGTMVLLDTEEKGIVMHLPKDSQYIDRPHVCLVRFEGGTTRKGDIVDLQETDSAGRFTRTIVRTLDPNEYHLSILDFLL